MHNHNKNGESKGMLWMMIPCLLLLGLLLLRGGLFSSGGFFWPILIGIAVVVYIWMMFRGHGKQEDAGVEDTMNDSSTKQPEAKDENGKHDHSGCCH